MTTHKYLTFGLLLILHSVQSSSLCNEGICSTYIHETGCAAPAIHCNINNATHKGMIMPSPTTCNCCQFCLPIYGEGDHCSLGGPGAGTTVGRCGDSLSCAESTVAHDEPRCGKMTSPCFDNQDNYDTREERGVIGGVEERPACDGKGKYAPVACVPAHTCWCQSEEGERIFGESLNVGLSTLRHMKCGCSRLHDKIKKNISPGLPVPVIGPRCTIDGNFNPVQCLNRTCYCVEPFTGVGIDEIKSINLDHHPITELDCYNPILDVFPRYSLGEPPYNYTSPCIEQREEVIKFVKESEEAGYNVDFGGGHVECYPDGTYGRVALNRTGSKICIDHRGRRIGDFEAESGTEEFETMNCKCAVTSLIMGDSAEKPVCCKNGNFRAIQCRRGKCRCVDTDGRQTSEESADVMDLHMCFSWDWKTC